MPICYHSSSKDKNKTKKYVLQLLPAFDTEFFPSPMWKYHGLKRRREKWKGKTLQNNIGKYLISHFPYLCSPNKFVVSVAKHTSLMFTLLRNL